MHLGKNVFERESENRRLGLGKKPRVFVGDLPTSRFQVIKVEEGS